MKIKNTLDPLAQYGAKMDKATGARAMRGDSGKTASTPAKGDTISLSPEAKLYTEAYTGAMNAPEVRRAKVDAIKARVDSGEYQIDTEKIAAKLLQEEPGLFG